MKIKLKKTMFVALAFASSLAYSSAFAQTKLRYAHVGVANAPQTIYADSSFSELSIRRRWRNG